MIQKVTKETTTISTALLLYGDACLINSIKELNAV